MQNELGQISCRAIWIILFVLAGTAGALYLIADAIF